MIIDKMVLNVEIPVHSYEDGFKKVNWDTVQQYFANLQLLGVKYYESFQFKKYQHTWKVSYGSRTVLVQALHNTKVRGKDTPHDFRIEWNPDRFAEFIPEELSLLMSMASRMTLKRMDIAYDVKVSPDELVCLDNSKTWNIYKGTRYYGAKGENQLVIYDKRKEIADNQKRDIGHELTRVEYRIMSNTIVYDAKIKGVAKKVTVSDMRFPNVYYLSDMDKSKPDMALMVIGARYDPIQYKALSRHYREKISRYLSKGKKIAFPSMAVDIEKAVNETIGSMIDWVQLDKESVIQV